MIDGTGAEPRHDVVVLIEGGTIRAVRPKGEFRPGQAREWIDASGGYLIPGLFDMHGHVTMSQREAAVDGGRVQFSVHFRRDISEWTLRRLLYYGITTVRETGDDLEEGIRLRSDLRAGVIPGPSIFACGPVIEGEPPVFLDVSVAVSNEEEARAEVRRQVEAGVDFVKIYASLPPDLARAVVDEAHAHHVRVLAHLGATTWKEAIEMGVDGIVHSNTLAPADILTEDRIAAVDTMPFPQRALKAYEWFDPSAEPVRELFRMMREKGVANDPTIVVARNYVADSTSIARIQGEQMRAVPAFMMSGWWQELSVTRPRSEDEAELYRRAVGDLLRFVRAEYEAGVSVLAGSDFGNPNTIPGLSLHQELELLVEAGIPPLTVLRIATHDAAAWLGVLDDVGTVEEGKRANLVVLDGDPLEDIRNTRRISWVIQEGRVIARDELVGSDPVRQAE